MVLEISSTLVARLLNEASATPDVEVCGLLLGAPSKISGVLTCHNVAPDPHIAFEIDPAQLIAAHRAERGGGSKIVGCYHSHPGGMATPSARDAAAAAPDGSVWIILARHDARFYRALKNGHHHGRFDAIEHRIVSA